MVFRKYVLVLTFILFLLFSLPGNAFAADQPVAIFHAFNQNYKDVESFVCDLGKQGYSHVQISPAQESNPGNEWWKRYQPFDYSVIEGLGSEDDLKDLVDEAHGCNVRVIADVVFNHMGNLDGGEGFENLNKFPGLSSSDFKTADSSTGQRPCEASENNGYSDGNRNSELNCWLGGLPDLNFTDNVKNIQKAHIKNYLILVLMGFVLMQLSISPKTWSKNT